MNLPPNLCYTIALDAPGSDVHRRMARLLVTSLIRTGWHGRIVVFRNGSKPVLPEGHPDVTEQILTGSAGDSWAQMMSWKYRVRDLLDLSGIEKVLFLDCDCIALQALNDLMFGAWDIYTTPEPGRLVEFPFNGYLTDDDMIRVSQLPGLNSGSLGVRASRFIDVMSQWERIDATEPLRPSKCRDQHSWNRLILDTPLRHRHFARCAIQFPFLHRAVYADYRRAALVHAADRTPGEKLSFLFGLWMEAFGMDALESVTSP